MKHPEGVELKTRSSVRSINPKDRVEMTPERRAELQPLLDKGVDFREQNTEHTKINPYDLDYNLDSSG